MKINSIFRSGLGLPILGASGLIVALVLVFGRAGAEPRTPVFPPPESSFSRSVAGIGVIEPRSELVSVGTELAGVVRSVPVRVGTTVKKGDLLFALDQREVDSQIAFLQARLESAKVEVANADAQFSLVASVDDRRAVAQDDFNNRKFGRQLANARQREIEKQLEQALVTKERLSVHAPLDGEILEVNVRVGEFAAAGALAVPLIRMGDLSELYVRVEVDEENIARLAPESPAEGLLRSDTQRKIPLRFVRFEPYVKPKLNLSVSGQRVDTRVLQVIYALPAHSEARFVGQFLDVFIENKA